MAQYPVLGRSQLLKWLNNILKCDYQNIEDLSDGVAYIQLLHSIFQDKVSLKRISWDPKDDFEKQKNFSYLKKIFRDRSLKKDIKVTKLSQGSFPEHYDLLKWMYIYIQKNYPDVSQNYDAFERRISFIRKNQKKFVVPDHFYPNIVEDMRTELIGRKDGSLEFSNSYDIIKSPRREEESNSFDKKDVQRVNPETKSLEEVIATLELDIRNRTNELDFEFDEVKKLAKIRNFYFEKLLRIEEICSSVENSEMQKEISKIISSERDEFTINADEAV